ncbi:hypothetical protein BS50DRAFT_587398 [Corynespora cassiicola Philippines]|uniref:Uncharacterized protein n=1 Tax=Corynespora cassiicola Philippines TaxID=1448308 RepID=A0A2T2NRY8_CORCC|nr:hypothetical protein BS50DRAFT_587398 [Corynespora cassiicola Philippines]
MVEVIKDSWHIVVETSQRYQIKDTISWTWPEEEHHFDVRFELKQIEKRPTMTDLKLHVFKTPNNHGIKHLRTWFEYGGCIVHQGLPQDDQFPAWLYLNLETNSDATSLEVHRPWTYAGGFLAKKPASMCREFPAAPNVAVFKSIDFKKADGTEFVLDESDKPEERLMAIPDLKASRLKGVTDTVVYKVAGSWGEASSREVQAMWHCPDVIIDPN